jgi:predicted esterase
MYNFVGKQPKCMIEKKLTIKKTIRYYTIGDINKAKYLIIALHGYGQLPNYFGRKFENLSEDFFVVLPEGLHRFYLEGSSGRVGASWMTKEDRESDIQDNMKYLNELTSKFHLKKSFTKSILLGFSQGGATAARFFYATNFIDHLILWACIFPPDLKLDNEIKTVTKINYFVIGKDDPYFTKSQFSDTMDFYKNIGFETTQYNGNHSIDTTYLNNLLNKIIQN